jgi:DNA-binding response OmpR family regulator
MSIKVLVFESDAAFAGELRSELGKLGCSTCVVDDGSVGLQQASAEKPDLILLSIELPRMNGFSVCNKLKKDASLKDVPLIIMSSESSEETFEQHRKLRTRAEDYVHKPIAFGELLNHIRSFVQVGAGDASADTEGIVIDDEIAIQNVDIDEDEEGTQIAMRPDFLDLNKKRVDPEVESFTDAAFGRLEAAPAEPAPREFNGTSERGSPSTRPGSSKPSQSARPPHAAASSGGASEAEVERLRGEVQRAVAKTAEVEKELGHAHEQITRIHQESDAEAERMQRDLDELKTRMASLPPKAGGGVSSREFLDLREALNKKDKEILALKTQLTVKDKDIFEARDKSLALERATSDLDDKILAKERELADAGERAEEMSAKLAVLEAQGADLKRELGEAQSEVQSAEAELARTKSKSEEVRASQDAAMAALKAENAETLVRMEQARVAALEESASRHHTELADKDTKHRGEVDALEARHAAQTDQAESQKNAQLAQARQDQEAALAEANRVSAAEKTEAIAARTAELRAETDSKLAALHRAQQDELGRTRNEAQHQLDATRRELEDQRAAEVAALSAKAASEIADARETIASRDRDLEATRRQLQELTDTSRKQLQDLSDAKQASDAANDARIADQKAQLYDVTAARAAVEGELQRANDRLAALEVDLSSVRGELQATQKRLDTETARADRAFAKWDADKASLERAKDALAVALSQLDEAEARPIRDS